MNIEISRIDDSAPPRGFLRTVSTTLSAIGRILDRLRANPAEEAEEDFTADGYRIRIFGSND